MRHRSFAALALAAVASLGLAACGGGSTSSDASGTGSTSDVVTLTVGATPSPHAKILTYINDNLAEAEGIKLVSGIKQNLQCLVAGTPLEFVDAGDGSANQGHGLAYQPADGEAEQEACDQTVEHLDP